MILMHTCNEMLLHYLLPFHSDFGGIRRETPKLCFVIQFRRETLKAMPCDSVTKELDTKDGMHLKLVEEPGEVGRGR